MKYSIKPLPPAVDPETRKEKIWRTNFYINSPLFALFMGESITVQETEPIKTVNPDLHE